MRDFLAQRNKRERIALGRAKMVLKDGCFYEAELRADLPTTGSQSPSTLQADKAGFWVGIRWGRGI